MPTTFNIKVISDPVCPQCYIAKKRLDRAIELYQRVIPDGKHDIFNISWHAYYLANNKDSPAVLTGAVSPITNTSETVVCNVQTGTCTSVSTPSETSSSKSIPLQEAMNRRFGGSASTAQAMQSRLQAKGQIDGIKFSFGSRIGSSRDAHRLIYLAGIMEKEGSTHLAHTHDDTTDRENRRRQSVQDKIVGELFKRYFEEDGDITSHEMLIHIGTKAGLNEEEVTEWLASDKGGEEVDREAQAAVSKHGISGVPVVFINESVRIDGAQDVEDFFMEFVKVRDGGAGVED